MTLQHVSDVSQGFVWQAQYFAKFSDDALHVLWQAQHFEDLRRHFAWQAQHFRHVVLRVFCESQCQGCTKW